MQLEPLKLDELTVVLGLEVPSPQIVLLQGYFEAYEGIGTVRTIDMRRSLVSVITTNDMLPHCLKLLDELAATIHWRPAEYTAELAPLFRI